MAIIIAGLMLLAFWGLAWCIADSEERARKEYIEWRKVRVARLENTPNVNLSPATSLLAALPTDDKLNKYN